MIRRGIGVQGFVSAGGGGTDADAQAFITAAGITDATQQSAINTLVVDLKTYGIWTKIKALYPFVGGTASAHKFNLKDPRDLDAAFRLLFSGGATHSSTGYQPNGVNSYADTFLNARNILTQNNLHISFYSRTDSNGVFFDIGASNNGSSEIISVYSREGGQAKADIGNYATSRIAVNIANSLGFYNSTRNANNNFKLFKNGSQIGTNNTIESALLPQRNILISAVFSVVYQQYSNRQCAFASIGDGLTDTEASNLYTAVQAFQTTLSRNV